MRNHAQPTFLRVAITLISMITMVGLACNLPFGGDQRDRSVSTPTLTQPPSLPTPQVELPPTVLEVQPEPGSILTPREGVIVTFDQPMDRPSVEGALVVQPVTAGRFEWLDEAAVRFVPDQPLPLDTPVTLTLQPTAKDKSGQNLARSFSFEFRTAGELRITERIPQPDIQDVDPTTIVAVTFNRPMVELGEVGSGEPTAFTLQPAAEGQGRWLNTSTFVFTPRPALEGGKTYEVVMNPALTGVDGLPLTNAELMNWQFSTVKPALIGIQPNLDEAQPLDVEIRLTFNQPMSRRSVEQGFRLRSQDGSSVTVSYEWSERDTIVAIKPQQLLGRSREYVVELDQVEALGGVAIEDTLRQPFRTVGQFQVVSTTPSVGEDLEVYGDYGSVLVEFSAPLARNQKLNERIILEPKISGLSLYSDEQAGFLYLSGFFKSGQTYRLTLKGELQDRWGQALGRDYTLTFMAGNQLPSLNIPIQNSFSALYYALPGDRVLPAYATNLERLDIRRARMSLMEVIRAIERTPAFESLALEENWQVNLELPRNVSQGVDIPLKSDRGGLETGLYAFRITSPQFVENYQTVNLLTVVSPIHLTIKESQQEVVVWAVNVLNRQPVSGREVTVYQAGNGLVLGKALTDEQGIARIPLVESPLYRTLVIALGSEGDPDFSLAITEWKAGISPWNFGIPSYFDQPKIKTYGYTDRPIYQPGQTVYYRYVVRQWNDARYPPPEVKDITVKVYAAYSAEQGTPVLETQKLTLSPYGTAHGQVQLPQDAPTGIYSIQIEDQPDSVIEFQVAAYRKPEIDLQVSFSKSEYRWGEDVRAEVEANYFFGAPAAGVNVVWSLYARNAEADLPGGYVAGLLDTFWLEPDWWMRMQFPLGDYVMGGSGVTGADGRFRLTFLSQSLSELLEENRPKILTLEITMTDESGFPVSQRAQTALHPSDMVIGIRPASWAQPAGSPFVFSILTVDWQNQPIGGRSLSASFDRIEWVQEWSEIETGSVSYREVITPISGADLRTGNNALATLEFTPQEPGVYRLEVRGEGAVSQVLVWVGGSGTAPWPRLPNQQIRLEADRKEYEAGDTAQIFIPNPLRSNTLAWLSVERRGVITYQVISIGEGGETVSLPITETFAPNCYLAVTLLGVNESAKPDFRQGYLELKVKPEAFQLDVRLVSPQNRFEPRQTARLDLLVKDQRGNPLQGEFSVAVVDKAIFALSKPNAPDIFSAFYGDQPLGVFTSLSLAAYIGRIPLLPRGLGGGGGGDLALVSPRSEFRDTAYWLGALETDSSGFAQIEFSLPDNLTTWVVLVRGLTRDARVGEASSEIVVSKDLLIRPVVPSFVVVGDRIEIGAIVQNNTDAPMDVTVRFQSNGLVLENPALERQALQLAAYDRQRVKWWVKVEDVPSASLKFSVEGGGLQDTVMLSNEDMPIRRYSAPQTFVTGGILDQAGEALEVISLPRSFVPTGGSLRVELSPNLAGSVFTGLEVLEDYSDDFVEVLLSRLLANLSVYQLGREINFSTPDLMERLQQNIRRDLDRLLEKKQADGGWGWISGEPSDFFLSAYSLWLLDQAASAGFVIEPFHLLDANRFVTAGLYTPEMVRETTQLDQLAFAYFVLNQNGRQNPPPPELFRLRERLNAWGQAFLAMALNNSGDSRSAETILAELKSSAVRSASGAFWQEEDPSLFRFSNTYASTSIVLMALLELDPASPLVGDAVRYLTLQRGARGWLNSYGSGWTLAALSRAVRATGELQGNYSFSATLNGAAIASGQAGGAQLFNTVRADVNIAQFPSNRNALRIQRTAGSGRLYYRAILEVGQPVETVQAMDGGVVLSREYYLEGADCGADDCPPVNAVNRSLSNPVVQVRLSITVPQDLTYLVVEDYIPAGAEIVNTTLQTTRQGSEKEQISFVDQSRFRRGWGWWYFHEPRIFSDHIRWVGAYVPAGTYILTYRLMPLQAGEFRVLPARAYAYYFPDIQGRTAGTVFKIE